MFRFSQWKGGVYDAKLAQTPEELKQLLTPLVEAGVDLFHCSTRRIWEAEFAGDEPLNLAGWTKKLTGKPVISVGSLGINHAFLSKKSNGEQTIEENLRLVDEKLNAGEFDLVAVGRALLADPEWPKKSARIDLMMPFYIRKMQKKN